MAKQFTNHPNVAEHLRREREAREIEELAKQDSRENYPESDWESMNYHYELVNRFYGIPRIADMEG